jgi:8-amino-7-oxononanoate synthase
MKKAELFGMNDKARDQWIQQALKTRRKVAAEGKNRLSARENHKDSKAIIPEKFWDIEQFPGYKKIRILQAAAKQMGLENPFFKAHQGISGATTLIGGKEYINFSNYNYLGLNGHPEVSAAAKQAIDQYGTSASASRPASGERKVQRDLEFALASMYGVDDCVVFVSGHATNVTTIGYLFGPNDLILHDALIHNSALQGIQLSGAKRIPFPHNDWEALDGILELQRSEFERVLIIIEGIYSMDGDVPDLPKFIEVKKWHKTFLMVDEAHSIGVLGKCGFGIAEHFGLNTHDVDIWMGTLSKALAGCGGYIAGKKGLVEHLKLAAPGFLYSVGMSPPVAAAALAAFRIMEREPERVATLQKRGEFFLKLAAEKGINTGLSQGYSVIPAIIGNSFEAVRIANRLFEKGINVQPIFYPAVEENAARLRFFVSSSHSEEQIRFTVEMLAKLL